MFSWNSEVGIKPAVGVARIESRKRKQPSVISGPCILQALKSSAAILVGHLIGVNALLWARRKVKRRPGNAPERYRGLIG